jgi:hypothetical protein
MKEKENWDMMVSWKPREVESFNKEEAEMTN